MHMVLMGHRKNMSQKTMPRHIWPIFTWRFWSKAMVFGEAVSRSCASAAAELWLAVNCSKNSWIEFQFFLRSVGNFCFWQMTRINLMASFPQIFSGIDTFGLLALGLRSSMVFQASCMTSFASSAQEKSFSHGNGHLALQLVQICDCK